MPADLQRRAKMTELAVIVPCFNERHNVAILVDKLDNALNGISWEVIFVDDDFARRHGEHSRAKSRLPIRACAAFNALAAADWQRRLSKACSRPARRISRSSMAIV
jgi:hypothetical protein